MILWLFTRQILTILHIFDHFMLKLTSISDKYVNHQKNHWKGYCGQLHDKNWRFCAFSIIFDVKLTSIDVNMCAISINIHLTYLQTAGIDIKHYENHWKVVLWPITRQKLTIMRIYDHFWRQIDVNWRRYVCYFNKYWS